MHKFNMKSSGSVGSVVSSGGAIPGTQNARSLSLPKHETDVSGSGGAYDSSEFGLKGRSGGAPKGTQFGRIMSASPSNANKIGRAQPLQNAVSAHDVINDAPVSSPAHASASPKNRSGKL